MDLNIFATQVTQKAQALSGGSNPALGGTNLGGMDFWSVILGGLNEPTTEIAGLKQQASNANAELLKKEEIDLALLQLALLGQDPDVNIDQKLAELRIERIANNPENKIEQLTKMIAHLTSGLPSNADESSANIEDLVARLTKRLETLSASLDAFRTGDFGDEGAPFKALIATGLSPTQLTKITTRIEEIETKLGRELTVEDLIAGVGNIIPVLGDSRHEFATTDALQSLLKGDKIDKNLLVANITSNEMLSQNIARKKSILEQVNTMVNALKMTPTGTAETGLQTPVLGEGESLKAALPTQMSNEEFSALFKKEFGANNLGAALSKGNQKVSAGANTDLTALPNLSKLGTLALPASWSESLSSQSMLSDTLGFDIQTGTPFSNVMQAAHSVSTGAMQAGQPHPATSMVAAQISKSAMKGEAGKITLQLDPPELGRVEVRLEFGPEKSVKAHMVVEKPETLLLLQRDASALERALQNAGLQTDGGSLNYEMASQEFDFNNNNRDSNGQANGSRNGANNADEMDVMIETTMSWNVDPTTGHVHYNILA